MTGIATAEPPAIWTTLARLRDSWWLVVIAGVPAAGTLAGAAWLAAHLAVSPAVHAAGTVVHLASLTFGFGAVLCADAIALWSLTRKGSLAQALRAIGKLHLPIWLGLIGLVASGCALHPDLHAPLTEIKLALVLVVTLNGLQAMVLGRRLIADHSPQLLGQAAAAGLISQICWWGATAIGFWNAAH